jgi:hypothetical protein
MPTPTIQTSIHGKRLGISKNTELVLNDANLAMENATLIPQRRLRIELTAAQVLAGFGTPFELVAAPGAGFALIVSRIDVSKAAGTAFGGIAAGEDMIFVYSGGAIHVVNSLETTGFLDSTSDEMRISRHLPVALGFDLTAQANTAIDYELLVGDITGGSPVVFDIYYERIDLTALVA